MSVLFIAMCYLLIGFTISILEYYYYKEPHSLEEFICTTAIGPIVYSIAIYYRIKSFLKKTVQKI